MKEPDEVRMMSKKSLALGAMSLALIASPLAARAADAAEGADKPGLLDLNLGSIIWVLVIFIILVVILYRTAWKNVLAGLTAREQRIRNDIAQAELARQKAEETLAKYNKQLADAEARVRDVLEKARVDAEQIANGVRVRAQEDAQSIREKAEHEIERAKNDAIAQIYEQTAVLATSVAEKILRRSLNPDDQRDLVTRSLDQLQSLGNN
jgi:F-type H+-transporting ATPase subunit b